MSTYPQPRKIGDILRDYFESTGLASSLKHLEIYAVWQEIVAPALAPHTRVVGLVRHKLYVEVDSSAHLHELRTFYKEQLLKDLSNRLPSILVQDIVFRPAPLSRA